jgi:hypothetical protein
LIFWVTEAVDQAEQRLAKLEENQENDEYIGATTPQECALWLSLQLPCQFMHILMFFMIYAVMTYNYML